MLACHMNQGVWHINAFLLHRGWPDRLEHENNSEFPPARSLEPQISPSSVLARVYAFGLARRRFICWNGRFCK